MTLSMKRYVPTLFVLVLCLALMSSVYAADVDLTGYDVNQITTFSVARAWSYGGTVYTSTYEGSMTPSIYSDLNASGRTGDYKEYTSSFALVGSGSAFHLVLPFYEYERSFSGATTPQISIFLNGDISSVVDVFASSWLSSDVIFSNPYVTVTGYHLYSFYTDVPVSSISVRFSYVPPLVFDSTNPGFGFGDKSFESIYYSTDVPGLDSGTASDVQQAILDLLTNGNADTGTIVGRYDEISSSLSDAVADYDAVEQGLLGDYETNIDVITSGLGSYAMTEYGGTFSFLTTNLNLFYDVLGDFRLLLLYPLLLGIILFFIGRGSVVVGRLGGPPND